MLKSARVILPVRDERKANAVLKEITAEISIVKGHGTLEIFPGVDFLSLDTVRSFAARMQNETIDILVNNAGMMTYDVKSTVDGNEQLYQVNHLAPFLLTHLLIPHIPSGGRVVFVASFMHYLSSGLVPSRYDVEARGMGANKQDGITLYCDTKMMNVMAAKSFQEHFASTDIVFTSVHPGYVVSNLARSVPWPVNVPVDWMNNMLGRSTEQGAVAQITTATHPNMTLKEGAGGKYFSDYCINALCNKQCFYCDKTAAGVIPHKQVFDKATRDWLWAASVAITKV